MPELSDFLGIENHSSLEILESPLNQEEPATAGLYRSPLGDLGLGTTAQDTIVTVVGVATSAVTACVLATIENRSGFAPYSFMLWFVPVGALLSGFVAASGYLIGAKLFGRAPGRMLLVNLMGGAISTYFLLDYLNYSLLELNGRPASDLIGFGHYINMVINGTTGGTGDVGNYLLAALQVLGFAVGGLAMYLRLRVAPGCIVSANSPAADASIILNQALNEGVTTLETMAAGAMPIARKFTLFSGKPSHTLGFSAFSVPKR